MATSRFIARITVDDPGIRRSAIAVGAVAVSRDLVAGTQCVVICTYPCVVGVFTFRTDFSLWICALRMVRSLQKTEPVGRHDPTIRKDGKNNSIGCPNITVIPGRFIMQEPAIVRSALMSNGPQNALVPVRSTMPARRAKAIGGYEAESARAGGADLAALNLVASDTSLDDRAQVEKYLPDILGRALARSWIDGAFRAAFAADPVRTLAAHRIRLPASIRIDVVTEGQTRPMVVVSEEGAYGGAARRLLYLQLVMVAGK